MKNLIGFTKAVPISIFQPMQIPKIYLFQISIPEISDTFDTDIFIILIL